MNKKTLILNQISAFVKKDFDIDHVPPNITEEEILDFLNRFIYDLIDNDLKRLFYLLYRLDINEQKVHNALSPKSEQAPHKAIAKLIFLREKQKAVSRIEYSEQNIEEDGDGWQS
ncbi:hypothetical protein OAK19_05085 [Aureispira]|nr:hypothetical protein [Aureispira sp.]